MISQLVICKKEAICYSQTSVFMPSGNMLFPVDEDHEAGDCVTQCLAASKKAMHVDPRHVSGKQYRVPLRAKNLTTYLSGISVMVINGNRSAEVQRQAEKRPLPNPFGDLGVGASLLKIYPFVWKPSSSSDMYIRISRLDSS